MAGDASPLIHTQTNRPKYTGPSFRISNSENCMLSIGHDAAMFRQSTWDKEVARPGQSQSNGLTMLFSLVADPQVLAPAVASAQMRDVPLAQ